MGPFSCVQYTYSAPVQEYNALVYVKRRDTFHVDTSRDLYGKVILSLLCFKHIAVSFHYEHMLTVCCSSMSTVLSVTLYNCSVGRSDCSRCHTADPKYGCAWCGGPRASCLFSNSCSEPVQQTCPAPVIHSVSIQSVGNNTVHWDLYLNCLRS